MRVCISGSRSITNQKMVEKIIEESGIDFHLLISGHCRTGVDPLAEQWAKWKGIPIHVYPAEWNKLSHPNAVIKKGRFGKKYNANAGFTRNTIMAKACEITLAIWDGESPGTKHMIDETIKAGKPVVIYNLEIGDYERIDPGN